MACKRERFYITEDDNAKARTINAMLEDFE
jgi:hypothetical protein